MDDELSKYRQYLVETEQKVSESYDKTVITLSGGALGISFAFIKNIVGTNPIQAKLYLFVGWSSLAISLTAVVLSLFFGTWAFRTAIKQVDEEKIYQASAGGWLSKVTGALHFSGVLFLALGLFCLGVFVYKNL